MPSGLRPEGICARDEIRIHILELSELLLLIFIFLWLLMFFISAFLVTNLVTELVTFQKQNTLFLTLDTTILSSSFARIYGGL
jgi:hypothetical protein